MYLIFIIQKRKKKSPAFLSPLQSRKTRTYVFVSFLLLVTRLMKAKKKRRFLTPLSFPRDSLLNQFKALPVLPQTKIVSSLYSGTSEPAVTNVFNGVLVITISTAKINLRYCLDLQLWLICCFMVLTYGKRWLNHWVVIIIFKQVLAGLFFSTCLLLGFLEWI